MLAQRSIRLGLFMFLLSCVFSAQALAADYTWTNDSGDGLFSRPGNWIYGGGTVPPNPPGPGDTVIFQTNPAMPSSGGNVYWDYDVQAGNIYSFTRDTTWQLQGHRTSIGSLDLTWAPGAGSPPPGMNSSRLSIVGGSMYVNGPIRVGTHAGGLMTYLTLDRADMVSSGPLDLISDAGATVLLTGGSRLTTYGGTIDPSSDIPGVVRLEDSSQWNVTGSNGLRVGQGHHGLLEITGQSKVDVEQEAVVGSTGEGRLNVSGSYSRFQSDFLAIGNEATGVVSVGDGASLLATQVGITNGSALGTGSLLIKGATTKGAANEVHVGNDSPYEGSYASMTLRDGAVFEMTSGPSNPYFMVKPNGSAVIDGATLIPAEGAPNYGLSVFDGSLTVTNTSFVAGVATFEVYGQTASATISDSAVQVDEVRLSQQGALEVSGGATLDADVINFTNGPFGRLAIDGGHVSAGSLHYDSNPMMQTSTFSMNGGSLDVSNGPVLIHGYKPDADPATWQPVQVSLDGAGSFIRSQDSRVEFIGPADVSVRNGAAIIAGQEIFLGNGQFLFDGEGTRALAPNVIALGGGPYPAELTVSNGAVLEVDNLDLQGKATFDGGQLLEGADIDIRGELNIIGSSDLALNTLNADSEPDNPTQINISGGSQVFANNIHLDQETSLTVAGGANLDLDNDLNLPAYVRMSINGGHVTTRYFQMQYDSRFYMDGGSLTLAEGGVYLNSFKPGDPENEETLVASLHGSDSHITSESGDVSFDGTSQITVSDGAGIYGHDSVEFTDGTSTVKVRSGGRLIAPDQLRIEEGSLSVSGEGSLVEFDGTELGSSVSITVTDGGMLRSTRTVYEGPIFVNPDSLLVTGRGSQAQFGPAVLGEDPEQTLSITVEDDGWLGQRPGIADVPLDFGHASVEIDDGAIRGRNIMFRKDAVVTMNSGEIVAATDGGASPARLRNLGTITADGRFEAEVFSNGVDPRYNPPPPEQTASLRVLNGQYLVVDTPETDGFYGAYNWANVNLLNGTVEFRGGLENAGLISGRGSMIFGETEGLTNYGAVNLGGDADVYGVFNNDADGTPEGGELVVSGGASVAFYGDVVNNGNKFKVSPNANVAVFGDYSGAGPISGGGGVWFEGGFSPGASPAYLQYGVGINYTDSAVLKFEILGYTSEAAGPHQYDVIEVIDGCALSLDGTLEVYLEDLTNGGDTFDPVLGSEFVIFRTEADKLSGEFAETVWPTWGDGLTFDIEYTGSAVTLEVVPEPATMGLLGLGGLALLRRRRRAA